MKSDIIHLDSRGSGFREAVEETRKVAEFEELNSTDTVQLMLLTEEMLSLARSVTGEMKADFWIEGEGSAYQLIMTTSTKLTQGQREELISVSTQNRNEYARSFLGRLRNIWEQALLSGQEDQYYQLSDEDAKDIVGREIEDPDWDGYERSVLKNLADDVKIGIRGDKIYISVSKDFAK